MDLLRAAARASRLLRLAVVPAASVVGAALPGPVARPTRWEYLEVQVGGDEWMDSLGRRGRLPIVAFGSGWWGSQIAVVAPLLTDLGEEAWELVGIIPGRREEIYTLLLKRPHADWGRV